MDTTRNNKVELSWLLQQIAALQSDTEYLKEGFAHLAQMSVGGKTAPYEPEDVAGKAKAEALGDIVRCRETTNQQLLQLYEKMYDDLSGRSDRDDLSGRPDPQEQ